MRASAQGFTGLHMLLATSAFFAVVIAVNVTMAFYASSSWSGLVVENTYVASQEFNRKAAAMKAMAASGIEGNLSIKGHEIRYDIHDKSGSPAIVDDVVLNFKRPVGDHEDFHLTLRRTAAGRFEAEHANLYITGTRDPIFRASSSASRSRNGVISNVAVVL